MLVCESTAFTASSLTCVVFQLSTTSRKLSKLLPRRLGICNPLNVVLVDEVMVCTLLVISNAPNQLRIQCLWGTYVPCAGLYTPMRSIAIILTLDTNAHALGPYWTTFENAHAYCKLVLVGYTRDYQLCQ